MDSQHDKDRQQTIEDIADERAVRSIALDTDSGGTVVIEQQNVGPRNHVGGGEFKNLHGEKSPDVAAAQQAELQRDAPIDSAVEEDAGAHPDIDPAAVDQDAPGRGVLADEFGEHSVEPNEPA